MFGQGLDSTAVAPKQETADEFVARFTRENDALEKEQAAAEFTQKTYINFDTEYLNARATDRQLAYHQQVGGGVEAIRRASSSRRRPRAPSSCCGVNVSAPAPADPQKRAQLTELMARLDALVRRRQVLPARPRKLQEPRPVVGSAREEPQLRRARRSLEGLARRRRVMREPYQKFAALANEGAQELGFRTCGVMWRSKYDMSPEEFNAAVEKLWQQVKPLYDELHCHTRAVLAKKYGEDKVPAGKPIPAQLLGNMWSQAVEQHLRRHSQAVSEREHRDRGSQAEGGQVGCGEDDAFRRELLHVPRLPGVAEDVLGTLDARAAARPRGRVSRERVGHGSRP